MRSFGNWTKRELELMLIQSLISSGYTSPRPAALARDLRMTLTKAHSYLTDLALLSGDLEDDVAFQRLSGLLSKAEVHVERKVLTFPIHDAELRIWLERKLSDYNLLAGESIRRDVVKISFLALSRLLDEADKMPNPYEFIEKFEKKWPDALWVKELKDMKKENQENRWSMVLGNVNNVAGLITQGLPNLPAFL